MSQFEQDCSNGFSAGNYANAYTSDDLETAQESRGSLSESKAYWQAFTLGFFDSYELYEIPATYRDEYDSAYFSDAGKQCLSAGYLDSREADYKKESEQ